MDILDDEQIRNVWAHHFSRRAENQASKAALVALIRLISDRSATAAEPESVAAAAERYGIPIAEFDEFQRERSL